MKNMLLVVAVVIGLGALGCVDDECVAKCAKIDDPTAKDECEQACVERRDPGWGKVTPAPSSTGPVPENGDE